jgi:hypothetical protein
VVRVHRLGVSSYRTPPVEVPGSIPSIAARDLEIAEVVVTDAGREVDQIAAEVRCQVSSLLIAAVKERGAARGAASVERVNLESRRSVYDNMREDGFAAMLFLAAPFGVVLARERLSVELRVDTGDRILLGRGSANRLGSIYAPARRRALAAALDEALAC